MPKERTDLSKYRSPSTGEPCTAAQYIAEIICQRIANKEKVGTLTYKFWNQPKWKKIYIRQVSLANKLIKDYGDDFVRFIKGKSGNWILSLGARDVRKKFEQFRSTLKEAKPTKVEEPIEKAVFKSRRSFGSKTIFQKIKEIDNDTSNG